MKILIFGQGYIAQHFLEAFAPEAVISKVRIEDYSSVKAELEAQKPEVVVNCAGKTGRPNVDWCEDHKMETLFSNAVAPVILARACEALGLYMVHIGSGCVYEGYKNGEGYSEEDTPNFEGSYYSRTKAWSERMLKDFEVLQLRLRMPFDSVPGERNFITKILKYPKVISVPNSISVLEDFMKAAKVLIQKRATGIYNVTNPGVITHKEILDLYIELVDPEYRYELFTVEEMEKLTRARRSNCGLSVKKLESEGIHLRPIAQAIRESLILYRQYLEGL
ncbi:sugar nucleotide-binding protein [Candidatus Peregrinibacteria bacterium]|nr:MAG: sugar nucleotide-binding protein [Candidatus Peregrinibacteria bacterium]